MHILIITNYFEPESGAAAVRLTRLAKQLQAHGHQITVLTSLPNYPHGRIYEGYRRKFVVVRNYDGIRVIYTWLLTTTSPRINRKLISQMSFMLTAILRGIGLPRPDVFLIEAQPIFTGFAGIALAKLKRTPYVLNISDLWPDHLITVGALRQESLIYRIARRTVDFAYRHAAAIITLSPRWTDIISGYIGESEKIHTVYNGVDLERFRPGINTDSFRQKYHLTDKKIISFIGTLATQYNFPAMMKIVHHFGNRDDVQFVFIGQGSMNEILEHEKDIHWIRWIDHAEIPQAWNASYLTFWIMHNQALFQGTIPAKVYEALACGVPIVAGIEGAGAEIIKQSDAGTTLPPSSTDDFINTIEDMLDDEPRRNTCSIHARQYAEQYFDAQKVTALYAEILLRVSRI